MKPINPRAITVALLLQIALPAAACDVLVNSFGNVQAALDGASSTATVCLKQGYYYPSSTITLKPGQTLKSQYNDRTAKIYLLSVWQSIIYAPSGSTVSGLTMTSGMRADYGVLTYFESDVTIWNNNISGVTIAVGVNGSTSVNVTDNTLNSGIYNDGIAQPTVWVNDADDVTVDWNDIDGSANGPLGDGELSCYDSTNVTYQGNSVIDSGASGIYMVNCDNVDVLDNAVDRAAEWGIDIVGGSDNVTVSGNSVGASGNGGVVFFEYNSVGGVFSNNVFQYNRQGGGSGNCNGINVRGSLSGVLYYGNTSTPSGAICTW